MAELTQENLERLRELLGYDHDAMGPWSTRDLQNHAHWLFAAYEERGREIERLKDRVENLLHRATTEEAAARAEQAEAKLVDERHEHALLIEGARQVEDQRDDFERRLAEAQAEIERDRTIVARAVTAIQIAMSARAWLRSGRGRGPYEYDDDRWHEEFGAAFDEIETAMGPLRTVAADMSNAPQDDKAVADVRRAMGAEAHVAKLRAELEEARKCRK